VWRDDVQLCFNQADQSEVRTGRARGADILEGPVARSYGHRELVVRDCNGLVLAFGEDTSRRAT
jgi:hypothetical protein